MGKVLKRSLFILSDYRNGIHFNDTNGLINSKLSYMKKIHIALIALSSSPLTLLLQFPDISIK